MLVAYACARLVAIERRGINLAKHTTLRPGQAARYAMRRSRRRSGTPMILLPTRSSGLCAAECSCRGGEVVATQAFALDDPTLCVGSKTYLARSTGRVAVMADSGVACMAVSSSDPVSDTKHLQSGSSKPCGDAGGVHSIIQADRGEAIVFPDDVSARGRLTRR